MQIDDELELGGPQDREVRRFLALEDAAGIDADLAIPVRTARSVAHQSTGFGKLAESIDRRHRVAHRQRRQLDAAVGKKDVRTDQKCVSPHLHEARKGHIDLAIGAGGEDFNLPPSGHR